MPPKATDSTSADQLLSVAPGQGGGGSLPFRVAVADSGLEVAASIKNERDLDKLIQVLQAVKPVLRTIYAQQPSVLVDPPDPPYAGDQHAGDQRFFEPSTAPHEDTRTGASFIITNAQKAEQRRLGYSEQEIREMRPEDAHRALGLIS